MVKNFSLLFCSFLFIIYLLSVEFIFIESSSLFMGIISFLSLWYVYEISIMGLEKSIDSHIVKVSLQFDNALEISSGIFNILSNVNRVWVASLNDLLSQYLSILIEIFRANISSFEGLVIFFDLVLIEYFMFSHYINVKVKFFLNKLPVLGIVLL